MQHFCRTSFLVLRAQAHSPHCVTEGACPPHLSPYERDLPQGAPLHPVFSLLRPDEKCCCATFLPDSVPCAPCSGALTAPRHRGRLSTAPVAVRAGSAAGGSPAPRFKFSGQTKNVAVQHFCRTPFLVLRAQAHSPHRVTEGACPPKFASICPAGRDGVRG